MDNQLKVILIKLNYGSNGVSLVILSDQRIVAFLILRFLIKLVCGVRVPWISNGSKRASAAVGGEFAKE